MNRKKLLIILTLLMSLTWIQVSHASIVLDSCIDENCTIEFKYLEEELKEIKSSKNDNKNDDNENNTINFITNFLDYRIQNKVYLYLKNEISLSELKKDFKKNLQKRKKLHKFIILKYNNDLKSEKNLQLLTTSWLKIDNLIKLKQIFFNKSIV